ncbi:MAG: hypothetical protein ABJA82_00790 [Myxococcales bacterium]
MKTTGSPSWRWTVPSSAAVSALALTVFIGAAAVGCGSGASNPAASGGNATGGSPGGGVPGAGSGGSSLATGGGGPGETGGGGVPATGGAPGSGGDPGATVGTGGMVSSGGGGGGRLNQGGAPASGTGGQAGASGPVTHNDLILYDDDGKLWRVNSADPSKNWSVNSGTGRDLQLVGGGKVMLGKSNGWDEYQLSNGALMGGQHGFSGTQSAHRLADGTTMLASVSGNTIVLKMVTATGQVQRMISYAGYNYVRLVRPTAAGTFLVTADTKVFEGDAQGMVLGTYVVPGTGQHVWKAMRLTNGNTAVATGYNATLMIFGPERTALKTLAGKVTALSSIDPHFFADFHVMPNGNYFVVNSQADSSNARSVQLLEFDGDGKLVWQQKQPAGVRSLEAAIVLDGVDTSKLQIEPQGMLVPAP